MELLSPIQALEVNPFPVQIKFKGSLGRFRALIEGRANENREMTARGKRIHAIQARDKRKCFYL